MEPEHFLPVSLQQRGYCASKQVPNSVREARQRGQRAKGPEGWLLTENFGSIFKVIGLITCPNEVVVILGEPQLTVISLTPL